MFKTIEEVLAYIEQKTSFDLGLTRVKEFMATLNLDYEKIKFIHVAGTNGKGSVSYYTSNILIEAGYSTGFFSSPSIDIHNDRIRVNNQYIADQYIIDFVNKHYEAIESSGVTMFEIDVAMALAYFIDQKVEYAVMETGMGGIYDGTNIVDAIISVITNIGYDHVQYLGGTIEEITVNKAGIIKNANDVVLADMNPVVFEVVQDRALEYGAQLHTVSLEEADITCDNPPMYDYLDVHNVKLQSRAHYQILNSMTAIKIIKVLNEHYETNISNEIIKTVLANVEWPGRFEIMQEHPCVIIDGAHNVNGIKKLAKSMKIYDDRKIKVLFSALKDKDIKAMIDELTKISDDITLTTFDFYRADSLENLNQGLNLATTDDYETFIKDQLATMNEDDLLLITGSLYFISQIRKLFK